MAAEARPFSAMIDPDAFLDPGAMPAQIAAHCRSTGQEPPATHGEYARAILESLALRYRYVLETLEAVAGRKIEVIHIVGGGSRNMVLNRFVADCTGRVVIAGPSECTAIGNILVQAMGAGELSNLKEIRGVVRQSFPPVTIEPRPSAAWDDAYDRYLPQVRTQLVGLAALRLNLDFLTRVADLHRLGFFRGDRCLHQLPALPHQRDIQVPAGAQACHRPVRGMPLAAPAAGGEMPRPRSAPQ
jgi:sugar (pentulose or hexulose) kinase